MDGGWVGGWLVGWVVRPSRSRETNYKTGDKDIVELRFPLLCSFLPLISHRFTKFWVEEYRRGIGMDGTDDDVVNMWICWVWSCHAGGDEVI